jgi:hypothetical protein
VLLYSEDEVASEEAELNLAQLSKNGYEPPDL